jgi:hypothetical protein
MGSRLEEVIPVGRRWAVVFTVVLGIAAWSFVDIDRTWFQAYGSCLMILAGIFSWPRARRLMWGTSAARAWGFLVVATFTFVAQSYWVELHRQLSQGFHAAGVDLPIRPNAVFRIGVGDGLDVRFAPGTDSLDRWRLVLRRAPEGFAVDSIDGVEILQQRSHRWLAGFWDAAMHYDPSWVDRLGAELVADGPEAIARPNTGERIHAFRIVQDARHLALEWNGVARAPLVLGGSSLSPAQKVVAERLRRRLRTGLPLRELGWSAVPDTAAARDLVLVMRYLPSDHDNLIGFIHPLRPPTFRLVASTDEWAVTARGASAARIVLAPDDTVRVVSHGERWAFSLGDRRVSENQRPTVAVMFVRGPRSLLAWMPPSSICSPAERCTLVSSSRLPPTIPHFDLSQFGLDTATYSVLGRVTTFPDSIVFRTADRVFSAPYDSIFAVPARALDTRSTAAYLFRVTRMAQGEFSSLVETLIALLLATVALARLAVKSPEARARLLAESIEANTAWALINILTVLFGIRLILGFRVTYAAPYHLRDADSAIGLWLATIGLTTFLLVWEAWIPRLVVMAQRLEAVLGRKIGRMSDRARGYLDAQARLASQLITSERNATGSPSTWTWWRQLRGWTGWSQLRSWAWWLHHLDVIGPGALAIAVLAHLRPGALKGAGSVVVAIAAIWAVLEYLRADIDAPAKSPAAALGPQENVRPWWILTLLATALFVALSASSRIGALVAVAGLIVLAALCWVVRVCRPTSFASLLQRITGGRWAWLVILALAAATDLALFMFQFASPTVLFLALAFLFLLAVRLGQWVGSITHASGTTISKALAYVVLLLAAAVAMASDVGLGLVFGLPLLLTFVVAVGVDRMGRWERVVLLAGMVGVAVLARPVLWPQMPPLGTLDPAGASRAFDQLGGPLRNVPIVGDAVMHSVVRGLAARHPEVLERLLPLAAPSPAREEMFPALEQMWGGRAYSAGRNTGEGLASAIVIGRGVPEPVSDAENTFAVYVMAEHGFYGALVVLGLYSMLNVAVLPLLLMSTRMVDAGGRRDNGTVSLTVGGMLAITVPALYVAASNIGVVPLTGQNMPILGLNAWSDVLLSSAIVSAVLAVLFANPRSASRD